MKIKNKLGLGLAVASIMSFYSVSYGAGKYDLYLNEQSYKDKEIVEIEGIVYLPLRDVMELLNYEVKWENSNQKINLQNKNENIEMNIGKKEILKNGVKYNLNSENILKDKDTYSPIDLFGKHINVVGSYKDNSKDFYFRNTDDKNVKQEDKKYEEIAGNIDKYLMANVEAKNFHGSVISAKGDEIIFNRSYSFANLEQDLDNKTQTKFSIGSISKQFTSVGILKLYENKELKLDDTVDKYLSNIKNGDKITIHNLLTHSSGLVNFTDEMEFYTLNPDKNIYDEVFKIINSKDLAFKPGTSYQYSNTNYLLLAEIIEKVSGMTYEKYIDETIFKPLNMNDSGMNYGEKGHTQDATGYLGFLDVEVMDDTLLQKAAKGSGNLYSTTEDLYKWSRGLDEYTILSKETTEKLLYGKHISQGGNNKVFYGYGFMIIETPNGPVYMHDGQTFGFSSYIVKYPAEDLVNIVLVNNRLYDVMTIERDIKNIIDGKTVESPKPYKEVKLESKELKKFIGTYKINDSMSLVISEENNQLIGQMPGQEPFKLIHIGNDVFMLREADANIEFIKEEGEYNKIIFRQLGMELVGTKDISVSESVKINDEDVEKYIGEYKLDIGLNIKLSKENEKLYAQVDGQPKLEVLYKGDNKFDYVGLNINLEFLGEKNGKMQEIILEQNSQKFGGKRVK